MELEPWASRRGGGAAGARARGPGREAGATGGLGAWAAPQGRKGGRRGGGGAPPGSPSGRTSDPKRVGGRAGRGARGARGSRTCHALSQWRCFFCSQPLRTIISDMAGRPREAQPAPRARVWEAEPNCEKWLTRTETDATEMVCSLQPWGRRAKWPGGAGDPARAPASGNDTGTRTLVCPFRFSIRVRGAEGTGQKTTSKKSPPGTVAQQRGLRRALLHLEGVSEGTSGQRRVSEALFPPASLLSQSGLLSAFLFVWSPSRTGQQTGGTLTLPGGGENGGAPHGGAGAPGTPSPRTPGPRPRRGRRCPPARPPAPPPGGEGGFR